MAEASRQRWLILTMLHRELELRFGRLAEEPELIRVADGYQTPRRDVVEELRHDFVVAQSAARARHKELVGTLVQEVDVDEGARDRL